jgi:tripartite-type tricarboxylate transporter receptor subunit TctC
MIGFCRSLAWIAAALAPLAFGAAAAQAQAQANHPDRPVKIIVPIGPRGSYDLVGRHLADALSKRTGQAFFVENKPGAGTVRERFEKNGGEVWDLPNDRLDAFVVSEYENWTKLIREAGIKLD